MAQYFNLTLDTTAPVGQSISGLQQYYKFARPGTYMANISATGGASYIKVWTDTVATGDPSKIPSEWQVYSNTPKAIDFNEEGTNYVHAMFMDNVGNISDIFTSDPVIYDKTPPACSLVINNGDGYTKNVQNTVRVTFSDNVSGVDFITLLGDIAAAEKTNYALTDTDRQNGYKDLAVTFSAPDGTKTVTVRATDFAGNQTLKANYGTDTIVFDTTTAEITALLRESDDSSNLPTYVNYRDYGVRIVTEATDITHYKVWEGTSEPVAWTTIDNAMESNWRELTEKGFGKWGKSAYSDIYSLGNGFYLLTDSLHHNLLIINDNGDVLDQTTISNDEYLYLYLCIDSLSGSIYIWDNRDTSFAQYVTDKENGHLSLANMLSTNNLMISRVVTFSGGCAAQTLNGDIFIWQGISPQSSYSFRVEGSLNECCFLSNGLLAVSVYDAGMGDENCLTVYDPDLGMPIARLVETSELPIIDIQADTEGGIYVAIGHKNDYDLKYWKTNLDDVTKKKADELSALSCFELISNTQNVIPKTTKWENSNEPRK